VCVRRGRGHTLWPFIDPFLGQPLTIQTISKTHRPQKLKCLISLCTNPVSILSVPIQAVR
jgi:hypothetical protein